MAQGDQPIKKWEGKACAELPAARADQVWPLLQDFCGLYKWFPTLTSSSIVEGINGQPGCVRYCYGVQTPVDNNGGEVNWNKQKLLSIDPSEMTLTYCIIDGNVGFNSYVATWKVTPNNDGDGEGCKVEWKYEVEPVRGWSLEALNSFTSSGLQVMAQRMAEAITKSQQVQAQCQY